MIAGSSIIGGSYTTQNALGEGIDGAVFFSDDATQESITKFANDVFFIKNGEEQQLIIDDYANVKPGFRPALIKTATEGIISDEISLLQQSQLPALVIFGKDEKFANPDYLDDAPFKFWNNQVYKIPDAGHFVQIDQSEVFNGLLLNYANEMLDIG